MSTLLLAAIVAIVTLILTLTALALLPFFSKHQSLVLIALVWVIGLGSAVQEILTPRDLASMLGDSSVLLESQGGELYPVVGQLITLTVLYLSVLGALCGLFTSGGNLPRSGFGLFLGLILFSMGAVIASVVGLVPTFKPGVLFLPTVATVVYLLLAASLPQITSHVKGVLLVYSYGSLLAVVIAPTWALQVPYEGLFPTLDFRLFGLASHPNILGPFAVLYIVLEWFLPSKFPWRYLNLTVALVVLLIAQSKTAWAAALIVLAIKVGYEVWYVPRKRIRHIVSLSSVTFVALIAGTIALLGYGDAESSILAPGSSEDLRTLTDRTMIWNITINVWKDNVLFGYGPDLWSPEFRLKYGLSYVGQAHNQFVQSLGEAGIIGFGLLLIYIFILIYYGMRFAKVSAGATLAVVALLLVRTLTETPFRNYSMDQTFFLHFASFTFLLLVSRQVERVISHARTAPSGAANLPQQAREYAGKSGHTF